MLAGLAFAGCATPSAGPAGSDVTLFAGGPRVTKRLSTLRDLKTRDVVMQQYDFSCGAAAISTLLTYYFGEPATEEEVILGIAQRTDMQKVLERRAFSLLDMKRFALARGYEAVGYKMDFDFLVELDQPAIVPVNHRGYKHFVVFKGVAEDRVIIADPAFGNYTMRITRFLPMWETRIGFVLKRRTPRAWTAADLERQARFMPGSRLGRVAGTSPAATLAPLPGQVQSITGPRPTGGSFLNIAVPPR